jgi:hypothetical protein
MYWLPGMKMLKYVGSIAKRSTIPKKLVAYLKGRPTQDNRRKYSIVKRKVKNHSLKYKKLPYEDRIEPTLSSITIITLSTMHIIKVTSNSLPAGVSASKMIS